MHNKSELKTGNFFLGAAFTSIGVVQLSFGHFPIGLIPVSGKLPGINFLAYPTGVLMALAGLLILTIKYNFLGSLLAGLVYLLVLIVIHIPKLFSDFSNPSEWTAVFEVISFLSGTLILLGLERPYWKTNFIKIGRYAYASGLIVFGILHCMYASFIGTLIPGWIPFHSTWNWLVIIGFFGSALSFLLDRQIQFSAIMLGLMFLIWFIFLHLPRVISNYKIEPEWTSAAVALAMSGVALLVGASANLRNKVFFKPVMGLKPKVENYN